MPQLMLSSVIALIILGLSCTYSAAKIATTNKTRCQPDNQIKLDSEFKCQRSGECIRKGRLCDYNLDCPDWEDEGAPCIVMGGCPQGHHRCPKSRIGCIKKSWECDGVPDCQDSSDENPPICEKKKNPILKFECGRRALKSTDFVSGGQPSEKGDWPWMAHVGNYTNGKPIFFCGGVLINTDWVLTAAHCFENMANSVVRLGEHDYDDTHEDGKVYNVLEEYNHPWYKKKYYDIKLLKIHPIMVSKFIRPICLPWTWEEEDISLEGRYAWVTGWGYSKHMEPNTASRVLKEAKLQIIPTQKCERIYNQSLSDKFTTDFPMGIKETLFLCAEGDNKNDACQGDSGGPLVIRNESSNTFTLAGIVQSGIDCGKYPGLYVPVAEELHWIRSKAFPETMG